MATRKAFEFTFTLAGVTDLTGELGDRLFEAGCDDASLWSEGPRVCLTFHRRATSLLDAIASAASDVGRAGYKTGAVEVEWGDLRIVFPVAAKAPERRPKASVSAKGKHPTAAAGSKSAKKAD